MKQLRIFAAAGAMLFGSTTISPAMAYDKRHYLPPRSEEPFITYGHTSDRPYYFSPTYGVRRYYRTQRRYEFVEPVYVVPSFRFTYGYPWSYPSYGYVTRWHPFP